jgi:uncharacterized protein YceK
MRKLSVILVLFIAAISVLSGCSGVSAVTGTVRGTQTNTVIAGAIVTATGENTYTTVTGIDGTYRLMLPPGTYDITAAHESFNNATASITVSDRPVTKDLTLTTGAQTQLAFPETFHYEYYMQTSPYGTGARAAKGSERPESVLTNLNTLTQHSAPEGYCYYLSLYAYFALTESISYSGLRVYTSQSADGPFVLIGTSPLNYTPSGAVRFWGDFYSPTLLDDTQCYFAMQLYGPDGETPLTESVLLPPLAPLTLTAPAHQSEHTSDVTLEWSAMPECDSGYTVSISLDTSGPMGESWMHVKSYYPSENSQIVSGLDPGRYAWSVRGIDNSYDGERQTISAYRIFVIKSSPTP